MFFNTSNVRLNRRLSPGPSKFWDKRDKLVKNANRGTSGTSKALKIAFLKSYWDKWDKLNEKTTTTQSWDKWDKLEKREGTLQSGTSCNGKISFAGTCGTTGTASRGVDKKQHFLLPLLGRVGQGMGKINFRLFVGQGDKLTTMIFLKLKTVKEKCKKTVDPPRSRPSCPTRPIYVQIADFNLSHLKGGKSGDN